MAKHGHHIYAIALGSNQPLSRSLTPKRLIETAMERLSDRQFHCLARSKIIDTPPLGPSRRRYANAVMLVRTDLSPPRLLRHLKAMERKAGRRLAQRWSARSLDLDIVLWSGGIWSDARLAVPHPAFRERSFVLTPLAAIAPDWRDPMSGHSMRQLLGRLKKPEKSSKAG